MTDPLFNHDALRAILREIVREELAERREGPRGATGPDAYLATSDAAKLARVAPGTIRRWMREGRLPRRRAGRELRVKRADLEALLVAEAPAKGELSPEELADQAFRGR